MACSDEGKLGTADAAAQSNGNANATEFDQEDNKCNDTQHNRRNRIGGNEVPYGGDASPVVEFC